MLQSVSTVYRRPLSKMVIPMISPKGKTLFKEAMNAGYMEAYFHLSDQFITQAEPFSCGPSTLAMMLNVLEIDPRTNWKGIWRWFSEDNITHLPAKDHPLSLSMFAQLAEANSCSVQIFYHESIKSIPDWDKHIDFCQFHPGDCSMKPVLRPRSSLSLTRQIVKALSRVSGCYAILNYDRKLMDQTGEGHYSPVTGYHRGEDRSLILDVARYKYPSHWAQIPFIYNSLAKKDPQSCLPRGMVLVSRNIDKFANICRITPDYSLAQELTDYFKRPEQQEKFSKLITLQGLELAQGFMEFLSSLPEHFWDSIVLHALQICPLLDDVTKREKTLASMAHLSTPAPKFSRWQELPHSALREVFEDLFPQEGREVLDFFWFHFRQQYASTKKSCPLLLPPLFLLANS